LANTNANNRNNNTTSGGTDSSGGGGDGIGCDTSNLIPKFPSELGLLASRICALCGIDMVAEAGILNYYPVCMWRCMMYALL